MSLQKLADKLSTKSTTDASGSYVAESHSESHSGLVTDVHTDKHLIAGGSLDKHTVHTDTIRTGEIVSQRQVGTVDVVETVQQVKTVPVVETTRTVETLNTGVAGLDIHGHAHTDMHAHAHKHSHIDAHHSQHIDIAETHDKKTVLVAPVVEETIRKDRLVEVQPVIHKEVEKEVVHHVVKHVNEAPAASLSGTVTLQPVVQEHVHTHIVEEVHPVIHREIAVQEVERIEEHITEHIRAPTTHVHEVIVEKQVLPAHVHDHHCHHEVLATGHAATAVSGAGIGIATGHAATAVSGAGLAVNTVTSREVLVNQAGPAVVTGRTQEIVTDSHSSHLHSKEGLVGQGVLVGGTTTTVVTDRHLGEAHGVIDSAHTDRVVKTTEFVEDGSHVKEHHHHLHLPHFLHGHKKDEVVVLEKDTIVHQAL